MADIEHRGPLGDAQLARRHIGIKEAHERWCRNGTHHLDDRQNLAMTG
jgi:hypothetical protein